MNLVRPLRSIHPPQSCALADLVRPHARQPGATMSPVPGVGVYRADRPERRVPVVYDPCLLMVVQGFKRGYLDDRVIEYHPMSYLAFSLPMPIRCGVVEAAPERPFLAIGIMLEPAEISDILLQVGAESPEPVPQDTPHAISSSPLTAEMQDAIARLVATFDSPSDAQVLGPMIRREILYRVLCGGQGAALRAVIQRQSHFRRIGDLVRRISEDCAAPLTTEDMSRMAGMSKTSLHESFKAITSMTPLQFVKTIRLHRARALMLNEGVPASAAGYQVGYASASQFSREFKRLFGVPPSRAGEAETAGPPA